MISLSKINLILLIAITSSTSALLSMETNKIKITNCLPDRPIIAKISPGTPKTIKAETAAYLTKLSPDDKTYLKLSIMRKNDHYSIHEKFRLSLKNDQNDIMVSYKNDKIIIAQKL
jgi:hypothetical protein